MAKTAAKTEPVKDPTLQQQLDGMTDNERLEFLDNNANSVKECEYRAPLTEEELNEVKNQVTSLSIKMQELEDEKADFMSLWKEKAKAVQLPLDELVREARTKQRIGYGKVWEVVDHSEKVVHSIAEGNLIVGYRKALPSDLAPRLFAS